jgi:hypothetical protein
MTRAGHHHATHGHGSADGASAEAEGPYLKVAVSDGLAPFCDLAVRLAMRERHIKRCVIDRAHAAACVSLILAALGCGGSGSIFPHRDGAADGADAPGESGSASGGGASSGGTTTDAGEEQSPGDGASPNSPDVQADAGIAEGGRDADAATNAEAGDAAAPTCHSCAVKNCPTQVAACGAGSPCSAFLQCELACSADGGSNCSNTCDAMDPSGETAYAALTLCDLGPCGAGCVALIAVQGP